MNLRGIAHLADAARTARAERSAAREADAGSPFALPDAIDPGPPREDARASAARDGARADAGRMEGPAAFAERVPSRAAPATKASAERHHDGGSPRPRTGATPVDPTPTPQPTPQPRRTVGDDMAREDTPRERAAADPTDAPRIDTIPTPADLARAPGASPESMLTLLDASTRAATGASDASAPGMPTLHSTLATTLDASTSPAGGTPAMAISSATLAASVPALAGATAGGAVTSQSADAASTPAPASGSAPFAPATAGSSAQAAPLAAPGSAPARAVAAPSPGSPTPPAQAPLTTTASLSTPGPATPDAGATPPPMPASAASVEAALAALLPRPTDPVSAARADDVDLLHPTDIASAPADPTTGALAAAVARPVTDAGMRIQFAAPIPFPARPELGLDDAFDQRIVWMVDQRITQAEMRVNPEGVGPIDVRLQVEGQRVTAQFNAANADVRQALEAGMDRLRDLLGQRGMELGDAQVGQQRSHGHRAPAAGRGTGDAGADDASVVTTVRTLRARGLVDEYA